MLPPVVATDAQAGLSEANALASDGIRVTVIESGDGPAATLSIAQSRSR